MKANQTAVLKDMLKSWKPSHKPFFDKECQEAWSKLNEQASKQGFDLDSNVNDFKKFKRKNKLECKKYFKLLTTKREAFDVKKIIKEERKASNKKNKFEEESPRKQRSLKMWMKPKNLKWQVRRECWKTMITKTLRNLRKQRRLKILKKPSYLKKQERRKWWKTLLPKKLRSLRKQRRLKK